jgi:putative ABC transport system permease protein
MSLQRFRVLHVRRLRQRPLRSLLSIVAMMAGVGLIVAMLGLLTSVTATARSTTALWGGASVEISRPGGVLPSVKESLRDLQGAEGIADFVKVPVLVDGESGWLVALEPVPVQEGMGAVLAGVHGVQAGSAFARQDRLSITGFTGHTTRIASRPVARMLDSRFSGRFVAADLQTALRLRGLPLPDALLIYGDVSPSTIRAVVGPHVAVRTRTDRIRQARQSLQTVIASLSILAVMGLVVGAFLLFNTMNMAGLERRKEFAALRALGSDRRSLWLGMMGEAIFLSGVGSVLGCVLGAAMVGGVVATIPDLFSGIVGAPLLASVPWQLFAVGLVAGIATAVIAAAIPLRHVLQIAPVEALRPDVGPLPGDAPTFAAVPVAGGIAMLVGASVLPPGRVGFQYQVIGLLAGAVLLSYGCAPLVTRLVSAVARSTRADGRLAAISLERAPRRVWTTTATIILSVASAVATAGIAANMRVTLRSDLRVVQGSDFWISTTTGDNIPLIGLPEDWETKLRGVPGVVSVSGSRFLVAGSGSHEVAILGVRGRSLMPLNALNSAAARDLVRLGKGVALRLSVGDRMAIPGASPPLRMRVASVNSVFAPTEGGALAISADLLGKHFGVRSLASYEVTIAGDADPERVRRSLLAIVGGSPFPVKVISGREVARSTIRSGDQIQSLIGMTLLVTVICAGIALLNTLTASVLERTRELALLRAMGGTASQIGRSVTCEAFAMASTGALLGGLFGSYLHWIGVRILRQTSPFHIVYRFSAVVVAVTVIAALLVTVIGSLLPARRAAGAEVLTSLSYE